MDDSSIRGEGFKNSPASELASDPNWAPYIYDAHQDSFSFVHAPRDTQRRATFLDRRFIENAPQSLAIPIKDLPADLIRDQAGPLHFIFHTGFCCSTLLARTFDIPGVSMGLKEPEVLSYLAFWSTTGRRMPGAPEALSLALDLLSRPLSPGETQIVKANNLCNHLIPEMMHARPDANVLILFSSLDAFLRAIARRGNVGRGYARRTFHLFSSAIPLEMHFTPDDLMQFTDLQIAALAWMMQARFFESIAARYGKERVRLLNSDTLLARKIDALSRLASFYELKLDPQQIAALANSRVFNEHAKNLGRPFDERGYQAQHAEANALHGEEIEAVRAWASTLAPRAGAPLMLQETLFS